MLEDFILFLKEEYDDLSMFMSLRAVHRGSLKVEIDIPSFMAGILITGMVVVVAIVTNVYSTKVSLLKFMLIMAIIIM